MNGIVQFFLILQSKVVKSLLNLWPLIQFYRVFVNIYMIICF